MVQYPILYLVCLYHLHSFTMANFGQPDYRDLRKILYSNCKLYSDYNKSHVILFSCYLSDFRSFSESSFLYNARPLFSFKACIKLSISTNFVEYIYGAYSMDVYSIDTKHQMFQFLQFVFWEQCADIRH